MCQKDMANDTNQNIYSIKLRKELGKSKKNLNPKTIMKKGSKCV